MILQHKLTYMFVLYNDKVKDQLVPLKDHPAPGGVIETIYI